MYRLLLPGILVGVFPQCFHSNEQRRLIVSLYGLVQKVLHALGLTQVHLVVKRGNLSVHLAALETICLAVYCY